MAALGEQGELHTPQPPPQMATDGHSPPEPAQYLPTFHPAQRSCKLRHQGNYIAWYNKELVQGKGRCEEATRALQEQHWDSD
jgi:hypothetical protein